MYGSKIPPEFDGRALGGFLIAWIINVAVTPVFTAVGLAGPNLLILFIILFGLERGVLAGQCAGFLAGLAVDIVSSGVPGPVAAGYLLAGHFGGWIHAHRSTRAIAGGLLLPFILVAADLISTALFSFAHIVPELNASHTPSRVFSTLLLTPVAWWIYRPLGLGKRRVISVTSHAR